MADNSWITEALVQFFQSPLWKTPVDNFTDDNCCIFSTESEMKLEYTLVHRKFKELIDGLLTSCVTEMGVSMEAAVDALRGTLREHSTAASDRTRRYEAKKMLKQIFNADSFSHFYTMMVKRNMELDILANASLAAHGVDLERVSGPSARTQRALDANGDVNEEEALRRAIEASLTDPQSQEQVRAYSEVCVQENVNLQVDEVERAAQEQKRKLEEDLKSQLDPTVAAKYRQEHLHLIEQQKDSQIQQIHNHSLTAHRQSFYHNSREATAEFSCPEVPGLTTTPSPSPERGSTATLAPVQAPAPVATTATSASAAPALAASAALPPIGHAQGALPSIAPKTGAAATAPRPAGTAAPATTTATAGPSKAELEQRAQYMREQREKILAHNRATRQEQLDSYVQQAQPSSAAPVNATAAAGAQKDVTLEIAHRLRGDLLGEGRKKQ